MEEDSTPLAEPDARSLKPVIRRVQTWLARRRVPLLAALGLRAAASLWLALVWWIIDPHFPRTATVLKETYNHLPYHTHLLTRMLLDVWLRWDAVHYMNLAWGGYENASPGDMNFWPLYPYLVRTVSVVFSMDTLLAGLLVATLATVIAAVLFWELALTLFNDERLANWTVIAWVIFPTSFFLVAPFTDSLFACLALASLLLMAHKYWLPAGLLAALAGLARSQGILLAAPLFLSIAIDWYEHRRPIPAAAVFGLLATPLGTILFMLWRSARGLPDIFSSFNVYTRAEFVDPLRGLALAAIQLVQKPDLMMLTEFLSVALFLGIQIWMLTKPEFRKTTTLPFLVYGIGNILFNLTKHNLNTSPLQSSNRYVLNALPAFVGFAWLILRLPEPKRRLIVLISVLIGLIACTLYGLWIFVG